MDVGLQGLLCLGERAPHLGDSGSPRRRHVPAQAVVEQKFIHCAGQVVTVTDSDFLDSAGNPSPEVDLTGSGKAYVLRDGTVIRGRWERESLHDVTTFVTKDGTEIALAPGRTWVELLPTWVEVELDRR